ncbi:hypothetical protein [Pantoea cypripedii]|nr:hypothetical protein [Pantoea cypripedii]MBP2200572.1 hypothetical protein [Pantoea cypripedii]
MNRNQSPAARKQWAQYCRIRRMVALWSAGHEPFTPTWIVWGVTTALTMARVGGHMIGQDATVLNLASLTGWLLSAILFYRWQGRPHNWSDIIDEELRTYRPADRAAYGELQRDTAETGHLTACMLSYWLGKERSALTRREYAFTSRQVSNDETEDIPYE